MHVGAGLELEALWLTWPPLVPYPLPGAQLPLQLEMHLQVGWPLPPARAVFLAVRVGLKGSMALGG